MNDIGAVLLFKHSSPSYIGRWLLDMGDAEKKILLIDYIYDRVEKSNIVNVDKIIIATTTEKTDDSLCEYALTQQYKIFRGDSNNLIERCLGAANSINVKTLVLVYGNYPLISIEFTKELLNSHISGGYDYSYNEHFNGLPYGVGVDIFEHSALKYLTSIELDIESKMNPSHHIKKRVDELKIQKMDSPSCNNPYYSFALNSFNDYIFIKEIIKSSSSTKTIDIFQTLKEKPQLLDISKKLTTVGEVGLNKLFLFPKKIEALLSNDHHIYPISVELSLTDRCNFKCIWCSDAQLRKRTNCNATLAKDVLLNLFADLREGGTKGIVIEGGGEPTLHEDFCELIKSIKKIGLAVGLITNGSNSLPKEIIEEFEWIRVSLDATTEVEMFENKNHNDFEGVLKNIQQFSKSKAVCGIGHVVTKNNLSNIEELIFRLYSYGVKYIQFRPVIDNPELSSNTDLTFLTKYNTPNFKILIDDMKNNKIVGNNNLSCKCHSLTTVVTANGDVYLCGRLNIYSWTKPIGNLHQDSFSSIWKGRERFEQIKMVADPSFCKKHCPPCRLTKFNTLLGDLEKIKSVNFI
ncbi:MAG: radical SAM protein [Oligoflexia bacterium]|nr:radical SAM protein [Oligoflexia bacterium]